ncbi:MAG TPA: DUF4214 domain-containing protein [Paucimonas sp.]|nr:DUF4214 domain-containing protein [Paucimonas sp.]
MRKRLVGAVLLAASLAITGCGSGVDTQQPGTQKLLAASSAVQADYRAAVQQLYVAYFGRPADPGGEANFSAALVAMNAPTGIQELNAAYASNASLRALVDAFGTSQESQNLYGAGDTSSFVTAIFNNVLGRAPAESGRQFWVDAIDNNGLTRGNAALSILAGALMNQSPQGLLDAALVANRVAAATSFTDTLRTSDAVSDYSGAQAAASARAMLSGVTSSTTSAQYQSRIASTVTLLAQSGASTDRSSAWLNFGRDAQHSAQTGGTSAQTLGRVVWRADVDLQPVYRAINGSPVPNLLSTGHYGSPVISSGNTVILPVKVTSAGTFRIEARSGVDGTLKWQVDTDYVPPTSKTSFNAALTANGRVYFPGAGGKLYYRDNVDGTPGELRTVVFYGAAAYAANQAAYDSSVIINTPLTIDAQGTVYFGFKVAGTNPLGIAGGIARVDADGNGSWVAAAAATGDSRIVKAQASAAPALSYDGTTVYAVMSSVLNGSLRPFGYLVALDSATLATKNKVLLLDHKTGYTADLTEGGTSSPTVGPDGDVYFGVLGDSNSSFYYTGWMLHYDSTLATQKATGPFGWDFTPSIVPASMVAGYTGSSSYLLVSKYNDYYTDEYRMAILDPNATQAHRTDPSVTVMKEVISVLSPFQASTGSYPEWCINTTAVDPSTGSVFMNSSDGYLYRWNLGTNTLSETFNMNNGYYQSYTPVALGPDGKVYSINNAVLMVIGK